MRLSQSEENYLKAIFNIGFDTLKNVSTNQIAEKLHTKASSVTDMIKKLSEKKLVVYKKYQGVKLSEEGKKIAVSIIRKHRLWESFLVKKLNFSWDEVHEIAEQLEHIESDKLINNLDAFLDFPTHDPHGDPIPDMNGEIKKIEKIILSNLGINKDSILLGVQDSSDDFLKYLNKKGIGINSSIKIISVESFDNSMSIEMDGTLLTITDTVAKNLLVQEK